MQIEGVLALCWTSLRWLSYPSLTKVLYHGAVCLGVQAVGEISCPISKFQLAIVRPSQNPGGLSEC